MSSGGSSADIKLTVAQRSAIAALDHFQRRFDKMTKKMSHSMKSTAAEGKRTNETLSHWGKNIKSAVTSLAGFGTGIGGVLTTSRLINKELEHIDQKLERAGRSQLSLGQKMALLSNKLPAKGSSRFADMDIADMGRIIEKTANPEKAIDVLTEVHGATSDLPFSRKVDIAKYMTDERRELDTEQAKAIGTTIAITLAKDKNATIRGLAGIISGAESTSRATESGKFGSTIGALPADLAKFGFNAGEALALGSATTTGINDKDGTLTRTALINFVTKLEEDKVRFGVKESGMELLRAMSTATKGSNHAKMRDWLIGVFSDSIMQEDGADLTKLTPKQARNKLRGRGLAKFRLMELLNPAEFGDETNMWSILRNTVQQMPFAVKKGKQFQADMAQSYPKGEDWMARNREKFLSTPQGRMFAQMQTIDALNQKMAQGGTDNATQRMLRERYLHLMQNVGERMPGLKSTIKYYTEDPKYAASPQGMIESLEALMRKDRKITQTGIGPTMMNLLTFGQSMSKGDSIFSTTAEIKITEEQKRTNTFLREAIEELRNIAAAANRAPAATPNNPPAPPPANNLGGPEE